MRPSKLSKPSKLLNFLNREASHTLLPYTGYASREHLKDKSSDAEEVFEVCLGS